MIILGSSYIILYYTTITGWGVLLRYKRLRFRVQSFDFRVEGLGLALGYGVRGLGFRVRCKYFRIQVAKGRELRSVGWKVTG